MKRDLYVIAKVCAFVAVMLAGFLAVITMIAPPSWLSVLRLIKEIALLVGVIFAGWTFTLQLKPAKAWRIAYLIAAVLCVLGALFGNGIL